MAAPDPSPFPLHARASGDLRFIRRAMERSTLFTSLPGWGAIAIGLSALGAAWLAARGATASHWMAVWLGEALLAIVLAVLFTARKLRKDSAPVAWKPLRNFMLALAPPILAGAVLTTALAAAQHYRYLPGTWLLLYGSGIVTGGAFSIRIVPLMGLCFMGLGAAALFAGAQAPNLFLAVGFGGLHIVFGAIVAWRYGG